MVSIIVKTKFEIFVHRVLKMIKRNVQSLLGKRNTIYIVTVHFLESYLEKKEKI